jgi:hypothetical protein
MLFRYCCLFLVLRFAEPRGPQPRPAEARNGVRIVAFSAGCGPRADYAAAPKIIQIYEIFPNFVENAD